MITSAMLLVVLFVLLVVGTTDGVWFTRRLFMLAHRPLEAKTCDVQKGLDNPSQAQAMP